MPVAVALGISRATPSATDPSVASSNGPVDDAASAAFGSHSLAPIVVVIAAYNEAGAIGSVVSRVPEHICGLPTDVVVVVDGATDATAVIARDLGALVCAVPVNRGQGAALRLGYRLAREGGARFIATIDADGQYDPAELDRVVQPLLAGDADFVSGSRRLGARHTTDAIRQAGVVVFSKVISALGRGSITDPANGLRAMRAEVTASVPLCQQQYQAAELLLGAMLLGFRVVEVPTTMYDRTAGTTKKGPNLLYGLRFARVIISTWTHSADCSPIRRSRDRACR